MKTFLQIAGALAFLSFFSAGAMILSLALDAQSAPDRVFPLVLGLLFVGVAFFVGPLLIGLASKCGPRD